METILLVVPPLPSEFVAAVRAQIPQVAQATVATVAANVADYAPATQDPYRTELEQGVRMAFEGFADLLSDADPQVVDRIRRGARALGRTEARRRRGIGALLTAYQIGTGVHWDEVAALALRQGLDAQTVSELAGLIFAYNQQMTAASVEGYTAETRTRERNREVLAQALLDGVATDGMISRAQWTTPETLTSVLLSPRSAVALLSAYPEALQTPAEEAIAVLVPDASRVALLAVVAGTDAVIGPTVPWQRAAASFERAKAMTGLVTERPLDTDEHLLDLVLTGEALTDLRTQMLAPLAGNERLAQTLRAWLLNGGRRDAVAEQLFVHPQTVRYRMQQIRKAYGERLHDPEEVLKLVVALG